MLSLTRGFALGDIIKTSIINNVEIVGHILCLLRLARCQ